MEKSESGFDEAAIMKRLDRSSPGAMLTTIASEIALLHRMQAQMAAKLATIESLQAVTDRIAVSEAPVETIQYPKKLTIHAEDSFQGALGFYQIEYDGEGAAFRWSGPDKQFSFQFFIDRRASTRFILLFSKIFGDVPADDLKCFIDGEQAILTLHRVATGYEAHGVMASRQDSGGTVLTFAVSATGSPALQTPQDPRRLGVLFRQLTVQTESGAQQEHVQPEVDLRVSAAATIAGDQIFADGLSAEGGGAGERCLLQGGERKFAGEEMA